MKTLLAPTRSGRLASLAAVAIFGLPATPKAQVPTDSPRVVLHTGAGCHANPDAQAALAHRYNIGDTVHANQWTQGMGRRTWYFDSWRVMGISPSCWIDGKETVALDPAHPDAAFGVIADSLLARKDATFDDYIELIAKFEARPLYGRDGQAIVARYPNIRYKTLVLIDRASQKVTRWSAAESPAQSAWIVAHQDVLTYYEPDARWSVPSSRYWDLLDANRSASWAEELAWTAAMKVPGSDECYADCFLSMIQGGPQQYWTRFPNGKHIVAVLARADSMVTSGLTTAKEEPPTRAFISPVRASLAQVSFPEKTHLLELLSRLERFVKPETH
jgi:hypothetical protein